MVVREGGEDGKISFKPTERRKKVKFGRVERVILMQLEKPVVYTPGIRSIEVMEAVKVEMPIARDQRIGHGLEVEHGLFFHEALEGQLVSLAHC